MLTEVAVPIVSPLPFFSVSVRENALLEEALAAIATVIVAVPLDKISPIVMAST